MEGHDSNIGYLEVTETLRQAPCLALQISIDDQCEESVRYAAMLQLELVEKATVLLAGHAVTAERMTARA